VNTEASKPEIARKLRPRLTFTRLFLGFIALCLLVWCLKTIHYALQPKYQGKTAEEWFALIDTHGQSGSNGILAISNDDPAVRALKQFGSAPVRFLWRELHARDSRVKAVFIERIRAWSNNRWAIASSRERNFKALVALGQLGPAADALIPELLLCAQSTDQLESAHGLRLLGDIGTQPEVTLPLFLSNVGATNPIVFGLSLLVLHKLGPQASNALPALARALTLKTNHQRLLVASAMVAMGDRTKLSVLLTEVQNTNSPYRTNTLSLLQQLKTDALDALPDLIALAKNSTNDYHMQSFTAQTIEHISPGAAKAAGLKP